MKKLLLLLASISLIACNPIPLSTESGDAKLLVNSMRYIKADNGLCFGVVLLFKRSTVANAAPFSIVNVDCVKVGL